MPKQKEPLRLDTDKSMAGILALLAAQREEGLDDGNQQRRTEVILAGAGLNANEIAAVTGKNSGSVRKTIERSRKKRPTRRKR